MSREQIEELLREYPKIKSRIRILLANYIPEYSAKAINYDKVQIGKTNQIYNEVEAFVIKKLDSEDELIKLIQKRNIIESALDCLTSKQMQVIRYLYFEEMSYVDTSWEMRCSERTIRNIKDEALQKLEEVGIMEAKRRENGG